jgi:NAD(P)H-nitrite reductase large subunit
MKHIVMLGNGISGITAARHIRKQSDHRITVISGETEHFFARTALMYIYMGHMKYEHTKPYEDFFWKKNRIELLQTWVEKIDFAEKTIHFDNESSLQYDTLILAVGSETNRFGWPGQDLIGIQGLYNFQDLESMEANTANIQHSVIIGGGLIGIEMAEMLLSRNIRVTMLVREASYWDNVLPKEESAMINRHIKEHGVDLRLSTELDEIKADGTGDRVGSVITKGKEEIACQFVGLTVGVHPNISIFKGSDLKTDRGVLVNEYLETNLPDVYAIGDCVQHSEPPQDRRSIEQIWYTGRIMGETVARTICGTKTPYTPGVFFNSAKFFDIEYQTYGQVPAQLPNDTETFYWEHPSKHISIRFNFTKGSEAVTGMNTFGMRLRHEACEKWISSKKSIGYVLSHIYEAHFDPEFFVNHEQAILDSFHAQFHRLLRPGRKATFWQKLFA